MKTILYHVRDNRGLVDGLENALAIARAFEAHLHCVYAVPSAAYVSGDFIGDGLILADVIDSLDERVDAVREEIENQLSHEDVSWNYDHVIGDPVRDIVRKACMADLIVTKRPENPQLPPTPSDTLVRTLLHSRTPLFVPGDKIADLSGTAVVAWNGGCEAANAVRAAVPLLRVASSVEVLRIEDEDRDFPDIDLMEYLSREGIHANLRTEEEQDGSAISGRVIRYASHIEASTIVMGGYSRSRLSEAVLGGVTRTMLAKCPVGLVIQH